MDRDMIFAGREVGADRRAGPARLVMCGLPLGEDLCIVLWGGDKAHIGAAVLSQPIPVRGGDAAKVLTAALEVPGHKEEVLFREIAETAARGIGGNVVVGGGIHVDDASPRLIEEICLASRGMLNEVLEKFLQRREVGSP